MPDEPLPRYTEDTSSAETPEELRRLLSACDARLRGVSELVTHTRHDLNNLLTGIFGQTQLILMREEVTEGTRRRLETLEELAKRMKEVVAQLNDV